MTSDDCDRAVVGMIGTNRDMGYHISWICEVLFKGKVIKKGMKYDELQRRVLLFFKREYINVHGEKAFNRRLQRAMGKQRLSQSQSGYHIGSGDHNLTSDTYLRPFLDEFYGAKVDCFLQLMHREGISFDDDDFEQNNEQIVDIMRHEPILHVGLAILRVAIALNQYDKNAIFSEADVEMSKGPGFGDKPRRSSLNRSRRQSSVGRGVQERQTSPQQDPSTLTPPPTANTKFGTPRKNPYLMLI